MSRTITTNYPNGVTLTNTGNNPVNIASGVSVTDTTGSALLSTLSFYWTITNSGVVQATGTSAGSGIALATGAAVTNTSGANISGYAFGVSIAGSGLVANKGRISSQKATGTGFSYNSTYHSFTAYSAGLFLAGGGVSNGSGAAIYGYFEGAVMGGGGTVLNAGSIGGTGTSQGLGVVLPAGGAVTNQTGGFVSGGAYGVVSLGGGYVNNQSGATITSPSLGVFAVYKSQSVSNQGVITGTKVGGVDLLGGGSVQNAAGGSIIGGYYGVRITGTASGGSAGTVINQGVIKGTAPVPSGSSNYNQPFPFSGVLLPSGGSVTNSSGATISGGSYGVRVTVAYGVVFNSGLISSSRTFGGAGVDLANGGSVANDPGGIIAGKWIGVQIGQAGYSVGGTFVNYGTVFASDGTNGAAVWIHGPGEIVNNVGATIAGGSYGGVANGPYGIVSYYSTTLINRGSIGGTAFAFDSAGTSAVGSRIEIAPGASFGGTVLGAKSSTLASLATLELLSGASIGTINGFGSQYQNFGNIALDSGARWLVNGTVAAGTTVAFAPGGTGSLTIASPAAFSGTITGFGSGETLSLSGITNATGVSLGGGNVLTVSESSGPGLTLQLNPSQVFTGETFNESTSGGATNITVSGGVSQTVVSAAYYGILRYQPNASLVSQTVSQIQTGQTTLAQFESALIGDELTLETTLPALVTIDAFYDATPTSALLTEVAASTTETAFYTAIELHNLGYSDTNVWTVLASGWGADPTSNFYATYNGDATGTTAGYTAFINAVYTREFGFAPSAANLQNLLADIPGTQALLNGGGHIATPLQVMAGLYGYLLEVGQTTPSLPTQYAAAAAAFLTAAANGTVAYGPELTKEFPSGSQGAAAGSSDGTVTVTDVEIGNGDGASTTPISIGLPMEIVGVSNQTIDPGASGYTIQFVGSDSGDTLVLHTGGTDQISGFDPTTDHLDVGALLTEANVNLNGDIAALGDYLTVVDQGPNALLNFDPTGHGGGSTVAVLQGLGSVVTSVSSMVSQGAIKVG
jgi:hypothetical protein